MTNSYEITGKKIEGITLPKEVFSAKINQQLLTQALHIYRSNQTQGTKRAKTRGEVDLTKKKVYRQKGTGNARHGAKSAPIFVGGGVAHGPRGILAARKRLNVKMRRLSIISALSHLNQNNAVTILANLDKATDKTSDINKLLTKLDLNQKKTLLLTANSYPKLLQAAKNIPNLKLSRHTLTNVYQLLNTHHLLIDQNSINPISEWLIGEKTTAKK